LLAVACTTFAIGKSEDNDPGAEVDGIVIWTRTPAATPQTFVEALSVITASSTPVVPVNQEAPTGTPAATNTPEPEETPAPEATTSATATPSDTPTPTPTPTIGSPTATPTPSNTPRPTATAPAGLSQAEGRLLALHNEARDDTGARPLRHDKTLMDIARERAAKMATTGTFSHNLTGLGTVFDSMKAEGYAYSTGAENIHYNYGYSDLQSAEVAMEAFMGSSAHRANLLDPSFRRVGIGIVTNSSGYTYFAVVFSD
jgi:uncharacterized protein YkwD